MPMNPEHKRIVELAAGWEGSAADVSVSPADATLLESVRCAVRAADDKPGKPRFVAAPDLCAAAKKLAASFHETPAGAQPTPNQQSVTGPGTDPDPNNATTLDGDDDGEPADADRTDLVLDDDLDGLTVAELKEKAEAEGVELTAHTKKADIVAAIRAARDAK